MDRPTRGEVIIAACGLVLLVTSALKLWGRYECPTCPADARWSHVSLWSRGFTVPTKGALILTALLLVLIVLRLAGISLPWSAGRVYVGLASMVTLLLVIALLAGPSDLGFGHTELLKVTAGPMLVVAWLLGVGMTYGGLRHMRETLVSQRAPSPGPVVLR